MGIINTCLFSNKEPSFSNRIHSVIDKIKFSEDEDENELKRKIIYKRYVSQVNFYEKASEDVTSQYNFLRLMITIGSMMLPTLQTIQGNAKVVEYDSYIFWASIGVSLLIMISNGLITLFKIDQLYTLYNLCSEKLKRAGWNYLERSGKYHLNEWGEEASYSENLVIFFNEIEQIKLQTTMKEFGDENNEDTKIKSSEKKKINIIENFKHIENKKPKLFLDKKQEEVDLIVSPENKHNNENIEIIVKKNSKNNSKNNSDDNSDDNFDDNSKNTNIIVKEDINLPTFAKQN